METHVAAPAGANGHAVAGAALQAIPQHQGGIQVWLVVRGELTFDCAGQQKTASALTLVWVDPARCSPPVRSEGADVSSARFPHELVDELPELLRRQIRSQLAKHGVVTRQLSEVSVTRLKKQFQMLELAIDTGQREQRTRKDLLVSAWAEHCQATSLDEGVLHPIVERAVRTLKETPTLNSMETLARMCGASSSWLSRLFRQQMGVSLVDFRNRHRIERFFELYREKPQQNIMDLASVAGFGSYAQFHRVFRKTLGFRPAELQRWRGESRSLLTNVPKRINSVSEGQVL